jgi:hypothetical protein
MRVSQKFINAVRLSDVQNYRLAMSCNIDPPLLSKFIHHAVKITPNDPRVVAIGKLLGLSADQCFDQESESE